MGEYYYHNNIWQATSTTIGQKRIQEGKKRIGQTPDKQKGHSIIE
jgi:hypothetical protein